MYRRQAQGQKTDLALHTLGWKSFQDLCAHVLEDTLRCIVEVFREAQDGGQDAVFTHRPKKEGDYNQGTAQCKFYSKSDSTLKISSLNGELETVSSLVSIGQAETYILMTNARVDAPVAVRIKRKLKELGVLKPHVFGREFFELVIRASPRLRALVPRIYGLGDLTQIIDERVATQTAALLGHMMPTLKVYVATQAHHKAVRSLRDFGITNLLGNPATGKSSIAAILSTIALENPKHKCFKVESPSELVARWNPNDSGGFYWIDDAFGPNSLKDDFVDAWMMILPKIQAAVSAGNQFVLTSRLHIYEAAKRKLGQRNHPRFLDGKAIVNVDSISSEERSQILYNHIKTGNQPLLFKSAVKKNADGLVSLKISPEVCRRLASRTFTKGLYPDFNSISRFVREPKQYLVETLSCLSKSEWAALVLVFLHQGQMKTQSPDSDLLSQLQNIFGVNPYDIALALDHMKGSFLREESSDAGKIITYHHPTIADAISEILSNTEGMGLYFVMGAKVAVVLQQVCCEGAPKIVPDTIIISKTEEPALLRRISNIEDSPHLNTLLLGFMAERASDSVLLQYFSHDPRLLKRKQHWWERTNALYASRIRIAIRLQSLGMLSDDDRSDISDELIECFFTLDFSFIDNDQTLALIRPSTLFNLKDRLRRQLLPSFPDRVEDYVRDAEEDTDPETHFKDLEQALDTLEASIFQEDAEAKEDIDRGRDAIGEAVRELSERRDERERDKPWDWEEPEEASVVRRAPSATIPYAGGGCRSMFDDMDT